MVKASPRRSNFWELLEEALVVLAFGFVFWFIFCAINATFWFSIGDSGDDILWREGLHEPVKQLGELKEYGEQICNW